MKMAKANENDLQMAMDLCGAFDALTQRFSPSMPEAIQNCGPEDCEHFDRDNDEQCGRALRHLIDIANRGSLMRVVWGMAVLLDPANKMVDPDADTLEHHPDRAATEAQLTALPKWAQSSESKGQFYRKSVQEMAALREQLTALQTAIDATGEVHPSWSTSKEFQDGWRECIAHIREDAGRPATYFSQMRAELSELREGCQALIDGWEATVEEPLDMPDFVIRDCARELQSLLTQTTPPVNSAEAVNGGEDSGYGKRFAAQRLAKEIIEERGENFAALLQDALDEAL